WFPGFGVETSPHHHGCPQITPIFTDDCVFSSAKIRVIRGFKHHRSQNYNTTQLASSVPRGIGRLSQAVSHRKLFLSGGKQIMKLKLPIFIFLAFLLSPLHASPPGPLPWVHSEFNVETKSGLVSFRMECPKGKLTKLVATRDKKSTLFPIDRLSVFKTIGPCSGVTTKLSLENESSGVEHGIELNIELSQGYRNEKLWIYLDLRKFKFTSAQRWLTPGGEKSSIEKLDLQVQ
ncbi:MAG: hypothetical protein LGR52_01275, partial [Candidatus Thiosymbion ectosymbiont of Robbea hypermnestra]|nr:hypothetical protein [Candidatus Thiosymbion ectosymbiont of Robbea hypermnestra]